MNTPHPPGRFLLVQHHRHQRGFYDVVLDWVAVNLPDELWRFDLRELPVRLPRDGGHVAMIPWLQDPVEDWSMTAWHQAMALTRQCDAAGIPVINRVERLAQAGKACGARLMASCGLRTARTVRIDDVAAFRRDLGGLPLPLFVREDLGHGGPMLRANTAGEDRAMLITTAALQLLGTTVALKRLFLESGSNSPPANEPQITFSPIVNGQLGIAVRVTGF